MESIPVNLNYNFILARYNELALKSDQTRARMERRLLQHIQKICIREKISLKQAVRLRGRFLFEINPGELAKVKIIFQNIIGIHSFSPCIMISNNFDIISTTVLQFAREVLKEGDTFAVRVTRYKRYLMKSMEIERILGERILNDFNLKGKSIKVKLKNPQNTIYIEIRDIGAYIHHEIIPTIWGGNPIEPDKALVLPWLDNPFSPLAAQLLIRRGTIIIPLMLESIDYKNYLPNIELLAKFYSEPIPIVIISLNPLLNKLSGLDLKKTELELYQIYGKFVLFEKLLISLNQKGVYYNNIKVPIRGIITPFQLDRPEYFQIAQEFNFIQFLPLIGLSENMIQELKNRLESKSNINEIEEFSLGNIITHSSLNENKETIMNIRTPRKITSIPKDFLEKMHHWYNEKEINDVIENIIEKMHLIYQIGYIL